ncbi:MAG TPA: hypothetical protein VK479_01460 [Micropepsaceae bacterium]|nr:hypothetical protein [Micropepsaceae bacterium]
MEEFVELYHASLAAPQDSQNFQFAPCWDSKQERITTFACELPGGLGDAVLPDTATMGVASAHCKIDILALASATRGVRHVLERGDVAAISVTVHVATLSWSKSRAGYLKVLGQIEPQIRALLAPRIFGFGAGSNLSVVSQWTMAMRGFVPWSFVHLPNLNLDFSRLGTLGARGLGLSLGSLGSVKNGRKAFAVEVDRLVRICSTQKAVPYIDDVRSAIEADVLRTQGVRLLTGPIVGVPSDLPGPVGPLSFEQLQHQQRTMLQQERQTGS